MDKNFSCQRLAAVLCIVLLGGCASLVKPKFGPNETAQTNYDRAPTFENALALGASQRDAYVATVVDYAAAERVIGLGLIGTTALAADLAIRSVGSSAVLGLGLASAAGYTANNWLFAKPQQRIFAAGANAAQCALDAMQPLYEPYGDREGLVQALNLVEARARALEAETPNGLHIVETQARRLLARAAAIEQPGKDALAVLNGAPGILRASLASLQHQVTIAYIENSPQMQGLLDALGKSLPTTGGKIIGVTLPEVGAPATKENSSEGGAKKKEIEEKSAALEQAIQQAIRLIDAINAKPPEDRLKLCQVDVKQLGMALRLSGGDITVQGGGAASTTVSGGVLPYRTPDWIGGHPPAGQLTPRIETGSGLVTVEAKAGATAGAYQLQVRDASYGAVLVKVTVAPSTATAATADTTVRQGNTATPTSSVFVKQVQAALNARKITVPDAAGKEGPIIEDGLSGKNTDKAMTKFLKSQNGTEAQIPEDRTKLTKSTADALGIAVPDGWSSQ